MTHIHAEEDRDKSKPEEEGEEYYALVDYVNRDVDEDYTQIDNFFDANNLPREHSSERLG